MKKFRFVAVRHVLLVVVGFLFLAIVPAVSLAQPPSPLNPAAEKAQWSANLYWLTFSIAFIIFVIVEVGLIYAIVRFREKKPDFIPEQIHGNTTLEIIWTVIPALILLVVFVFMIRTMTATAAIPDDAMLVRATGHQWWWEFEYPDLGITTANELHMPADQALKIELISDNVIHSFWVPRLSGKTDLIPGQVNTTWLQTDQVGTYRGQCAELCGAQHANMNFLVVVEAGADFQAWVEQQQAPPAEPATELEQAGQQAFLGGQCIACHAIEGTIAQGIIGPNLTHFGSRQSIGALAMDNTPENLATWLADPQKVKPLNQMVIQPLSQDEIEALTAYLSSLK